MNTTAPPPIMADHTDRIALVLIGVAIALALVALVLAMNTASSPHTVGAIADQPVQLAAIGLRGSFAAIGVRGIF